MQVTAPEVTIPLPEQEANALAQAREQLRILSIEVEKTQKLVSQEEANLKLIVERRMGAERDTEKVLEAVENAKKKLDVVLIDIADKEKTLQELRAALSESNKELKDAKKALEETEISTQLMVDAARKEHDIVAAQRSVLDFEIEAFEKKRTKLLTALE